MHPPKLVRGLFDWYYTRIYVHVRPERVFVWESGEVTSAPECSTPTSRRSAPATSRSRSSRTSRPAGGEVAWDERIEELGAPPQTAVLAWVAPDGFPLAVRVP